MDDRVNTINHAVIMGGGIAGLSAAHALTRAQFSTTVVEAGKHVGGLARTIERDGFRFDLGGHRFVTQDQKIDHFVRGLLGDDCLMVPRSSKIALRGRYFDYPLKPFNALFGFGLKTSAGILSDYFLQGLRSQFNGQKPVSLEDWVVAHFGRKMFKLYFKDYSEKVWGLDCSQIDQKWVIHRIQGLSLARAILHALTPSRGAALATLAERFLYPKYGIGQICDNLAKPIQGINPIYTLSPVKYVHHENNRIRSIDITCNNTTSHLSASHFVSTIPLPVLIKSLRPRPPQEILEAAAQLRSRDLVTVTLMLDKPRVTDHTWIYFPEKHIPFGRIHEPTNWSRHMAPEGKSLLVAEYFCFRGDDTWNRDDVDLVKLTHRHLKNLGIIEQHKLIGQAVMRIPHAYPLFQLGYEQYCHTIYRYLERFENLHTAGRGGMFRYHNLDHAMKAGFDAAQAILEQTKPSKRPPLQLPVNTLSGSCP